MTAVDIGPGALAATIRARFGPRAARRMRCESRAPFRRLIVEEVEPTGPRGFERRVTFVDGADGPFQPLVEEAPLTESVLEDDAASWSRLPAVLRAQGMAAVDRWTRDDGGRRPRVRLRLAEDVLVQVRLGRFGAHVAIAAKSDHTVGARGVTSLPRLAHLVTGLLVYWVWTFLQGSFGYHDGFWPGFGFALASFWVGVGIVGVLWQVRQQRSRIEP